MIAYERTAMVEKPDWIVVIGDVNSTAACASLGAKLSIPVIYLEAGLRSRDRQVPEEINHVVADPIADVLRVPSADADENVRAEGVLVDRIECIGHVTTDCYEMIRQAFSRDGTRDSLGLNGGRYGVVTLHRPSNWDRYSS